MPFEDQQSVSFFTSRQSSKSEDNVEVDLKRFGMESSSTAKQNSNEKYSFNYRVIKTLLLILTWITFGLNFELIGSTMEDLKLYLDVNYSTYSFGLVLRNVGYLTVTLMLGFLLDRFTAYSDVLMAFSSIVIGIS